MRRTFQHRLDALMPVSPEFAQPFAPFSLSDLRSARQWGVLALRGVVALAGNELRAGRGSEKGMERVALLLSDEYDRVDELLDVDRSEVSLEFLSPTWWPVLVGWILRQESSAQVTCDLVDTLYDDLNYLPELEGLVSYMPRTAGGPEGTSQLRAAAEACVAAARHQRLELTRFLDT